MEFESIKSALEERIGAKIDMIKRCGSTTFGIDSKHDTDILLFTKERVNEKHFSYEGYDVFVRDIDELEKIKTLNYDHPFIIPIIATFDDETAEYMGWNPLEHKYEVLDYLKPILKNSLFHGMFGDKDGNPTRQNKRVSYALAVMYKFQNNSLELTEEQLQHVINAHDKCVDETEIDKAEEFFGFKAERLEEEARLNKISAHQAELQEIAAIEQWFKTYDYYPNKIITGEWTTDNPKWIAYLEERQIKRKRYDELIARLE